MRPYQPRGDAYTFVRAVLVVSHSLPVVQRGEAPRGVGRWHAPQVPETRPQGNPLAALRGRGGGVTGDSGTALILLALARRLTRRVRSGISRF
jgi:hypothetical protein